MNKKDKKKQTKNLCRIKYKKTLGGYLRRRFYTIKNRCNNHSCLSYPHYGGAGIKCEFENFDEFYSHIVNDLGFTSVEELKGFHIHRINNGNYAVGQIELIFSEEHYFKHKLLRLNKENGDERFTYAEDNYSENSNANSVYQERYSNLNIKKLF